MTMKLKTFGTIKVGLFFILVILTVIIQHMFPFQVVPSHHTIYKPNFICIDNNALTRIAAFRTGSLCIICEPFHPTYSTSKSTSA